MSNENPVKILKDSRLVLEQPGAWTRGWYSRKANRQLCEPNSQEAVCFCAVGAVKRVLDQGDVGGLPIAVAKPLYTAFGVDDLEEVPDQNDRRSTKHEHVLMAFDFAILMAKDAEKERKKAK